MRNGCGAALFHTGRGPLHACKVRPPGRAAQSARSEFDSTSPGGSPDCEAGPQAAFRGAQLRGAAARLFARGHSATPVCRIQRVPKDTVIIIRRFESKLIICNCEVTFNVPNRAHFAGAGLLSRTQSNASHLGLNANPLGVPTRPRPWSTAMPATQPRPARVGCTLEVQITFRSRDCNDSHHPRADFR